MAAIKAPVATEHVEQMHLFMWAAYEQPRLPELRLMFAIPNGGLRQKTTAAQLRCEGVKAGVPDICLPVPRNGRHALYIEMKRTRGGRLSPEQKIWLSDLEEQGNECHVCFGFDEAKAVIEKYLKGDGS